MSAGFQKAAVGVARWLGSPAAFFGACALTVAWGAAGPIFHWSDTWQLVANTATTIVTFLMVFLLQATQNRDSAAIHAKLDELIEATHGARAGLERIENKSPEEIERVRSGR